MRKVREKLNQLVKEVTETIKVSEKEVLDYFRFLDDLRESGTTNMFGGVGYLMKEYKNLSRKDAGLVLLKWMESYGN